MHRNIMGMTFNLLKTSPGILGLGSMRNACCSKIKSPSMGIKNLIIGSFLLCRRERCSRRPEVSVDLLTAHVDPPLKTVLIFSQRTRSP